MEFFMAFAIKRRPPPLMALIFIQFFPTCFLLQLNPTYMKRILHLVPANIIIFKSSYNWFKIDIIRLLHLLNSWSPQLLY